MKTSKIIAAVAAGLIILSALAWLGRPSPAAVNQTPTGESGELPKLTADTANFDFGAISMAAGKVRHSFRIRNSGGEAITVRKMYTSCMCTTASLTTPEGSFGPFGMPGHMPIPEINAALAPGEGGEVEAIFDPAAHGPAGVGKIDRSVILENDEGSPLELKFSAFVTP